MCLSPARGEGRTCCAPERQAPSSTSACIGRTAAGEGRAGRRGADIPSGVASGRSESRRRDGAQAGDKRRPASAIRGSRRSPPAPPLVRRQYGRVRTPSKCRRRPVSVHRSAACSPPGRCAGKPRPDGRSFRQRSFGNRGSSGETAQALPRSLEGTAPRSIPASHRPARRRGELPSLSKTDCPSP